MSGNEQLALTARDRQVLQEVQRHGAVTRHQLLRLKLFASKTRANDRLRRLAATGYLRARPQPLIAGGPRLVYFPGPALTGSQVRNHLRDSSELFLEHHLGIVDLRIAFEQHSKVLRWLSEKDLAPLSLGVVPDAYVEYERDGLSFSAFIEYDRGTEPLGRIEAKARAYAALAFSGTFQQKFGRKYFRALFVTDTTRRLQTMSRAVARVTNRVVHLSTLEPVTTSGPFAAIWTRPGDQVPQSLT